MFENYREGLSRKKAISRFLHVKQHLSGGHDVPQLVSYISEGKGSPRACAAALSSYAFANAVNEWFEFSSLSSMKNWMYVSARLSLYEWQLEIDVSAPIVNMLSFFCRYIRRGTDD